MDTVEKTVDTAEKATKKSAPKGPKKVKIKLFKLSLIHI